MVTCECYHSLSVIQVCKSNRIVVVEDRISDHPLADGLFRFAVFWVQKIDLRATVAATGPEIKVSSSNWLHKLHLFWQMEK